jgi:hexulose-6-phosphate isomerase, putative
MLGRHLLGIYEKAFDQSDIWPVRLQKAKNAGFDYMEISVDEQDDRIERLYWSRHQRLQLYRQTFHYEMPLRSMCLSAHRRFPFGSADPALREKACDLMSRAIEFACDLGVRVIQLAGYDVYYEPSTPESVERFVKGMTWAARQAEKSQVMLAMEIMDTPFLNSITKYLHYERKIRSPWYKVYPDLGNLSAWPENDPAAELAKGISSIVGVHIKETKAVKGEYPGQFKCVEFGSGCVDFPARFDQLERLGYLGPYLMEMWHQPGQDDMEQVRKSKAFIERQFYTALEG